MGQNSSVDDLPEYYTITVPVLEHYHYPDEERTGCCGNNVPKFDTTQAKNDPGLLHLIGNRKGSGLKKIDQKFHELGTKIQEISLNPWLVLLAKLLCVIPVINIPILCGLIFWWNPKYHGMIADHFKDWREVGIEAEYIEGAEPLAVEWVARIKMPRSQ